MTLLRLPATHTPAIPAGRTDAVLLDFDHTLAHLGSFVRWEDARRTLLPLYGAGGVPEAFLERHPGALDLYGQVAISELLADAGIREAHRQASLALAAFEAEAVPRTRLTPGAVAVLRRLPALGLPTGIVSSNAAPVVAAVLERERVSSAFGAIVGRDDVARLKPAPEGLLKCCAALGVRPGRCIYVGDSVSDIKAARAAGMTGFGVVGGMASADELVAAGAEAVVDDLARLLSLIEGAKLPGRCRRVPGEASPQSNGEVRTVP